MVAGLLGPSGALALSPALLVMQQGPGIVIIQFPSLEAAIAWETDKSGSLVILGLNARQVA